MFQNRYGVESAGMKPSEWLEKHTTLRGRPFSFNKYPFQRMLVDDDHQNTVTKKPSQVGVSEVYQRVALMFLARHRSTKGIYAYPDDDMRKKNVQTRVQPMVDEEEIFNRQNGDKKPVRSITLLQINQSFLYMTGSKEGDATSTDADFVFLDEYDLHDMDIAGLFSSRLLNSEHKIKKYFSTPTFTQYGVDGLYEASDQTEYQIKCSGCNTWQFPMFEEKYIHMPGLPSGLESLLEIDQAMVEHYNIDLDASYVCCGHCRKPLNLGTEENRAWVSKYPSRKYTRGFRVNPFSVSTRPPRDLVIELIDAKKMGTSMRRFKNTQLGEAEDSSSVRISEAAVKACIRSPLIGELSRTVPTFIGIDMGHTCHITVGQGFTTESMKVVSVEAVPLAQVRQRAADLCKMLNVVAGLCDRHPESQVAEDIRVATNGKILPCEYRGEKEIHEVKDPVGTVIYLQANRTTLLDKVARAVRGQHLEYWGYGIMETDIITHLRNMIRVEEPEKPAIWNKLAPQDHIFHSTGFMLTACDYAQLQMQLNSSVGSVIMIAGVEPDKYNGPQLIGLHSGSNSANKAEKYGLQLLI